MRRSIVLLLILLSVFAPTRSYAAVSPYDIIAGKVPNNLDWLTQYTDDDLTTYNAFTYLSTFTWDLGRIADVSKYSVNVTVTKSTSLVISFYDQTNKLISESSVGTTGNYVVTPKNVRYIRITASGSGYVNLYDFKVFGLYGLPTPSDLIATPITRGVSLQWQDLDTPGFLRYEITVDGVVVGNTTSKAYTVNGLVPDQKYDIGVYAVYDVARTDAVHVNAVAWADELEKPVIKANAGYDKIALEYSVGRAVAYELYIDGDYLSTSSQSNYLHTDLAVSEKHTYKVIAVDKYNRKISSDEIEATTQVPPPPVNVVLQANTIKHNSINLSWTAAGTLYQVLSGDGGLVQISVSNYATISDLEPEADYTFQVVTTDLFGRKLVSNTITAKTLSLPAPKPPVVRFLSVTNKSVRVIWDNVGSQYTLSLNGAELTQTQGLFYQLEGLDANTTYTVTVTALDDYGREVPGSAQFTTLAPSPTPSPGSPGNPGGGNGGPGGGYTPPPVADSGNPDLDKPVDHLVDGGKQVKDNGMSAIVIIIGVVILIFGSAWLIKLFRKKMGQANSKGKSNVSARGTSSKGIPAKASTAKPTNGRRNYTTSQNGTRRKKYYVEKVYPSRNSRRR